MEEHSDTPQKENVEQANTSTADTPAAIVDAKVSSEVPSVDSQIEISTNDIMAAIAAMKEKAPKKYNEIVPSDKEIAAFIEELSQKKGDKAVLDLFERVSSPNPSLNINEKTLLRKHVPELREKSADLGRRAVLSFIWAGLTGFVGATSAINMLPGDKQEVVLQGIDNTNKALQETQKTLGTPSTKPKSISHRSKLENFRKFVEKGEDIEEKSMDEDKFYKTMDGMISDLDVPNSDQTFNMQSIVAPIAGGAFCLSSTHAALGAIKNKQEAHLRVADYIVEQIRALALAEKNQLSEVSGRSV